MGKSGLSFGRKFLTLVLVAALACMVFGCTAKTETKTSEEAAEPSEPVAPEKITVMLAWKLTPDAALWVVAKEKGFFEEEGLEVDLREPAGSGEAIKLVSTGNADIGLAYPDDILMAVDQGAPLVAVGAIHQRNAAGYASLDPTVKGPKDFPGKTIGRTTTKSTMNRISAMLEDAGVDPASVNFVDTGFTPNQFLLSGQVAAAGNVEFVDVPVLEASGADIQAVWQYFEWGAPEGYGHTVFVTQDTLKNRPETIKKFLRAVYKAVQYTIDNPDEAAALYKEKYPDTATGIEKTCELIGPYFQSDDTEELGLGAMSEEKWQELIDFVTKYQMITTKIDASTIYTNDCIPGTEE